MRFYETTIVLNPQTDEASVEREIEKITNTISKAQGRLVVTQKWGNKRLAYAIQKHVQGNYIHFVYQAPPEVPGELETAFRINEAILRHLTVLVEGPMPNQKSGEGQEGVQAVAMPVHVPTVAAETTKEEA